ncbi:MAG: hypothetical protein NTX33_04200 [Propionibacteriales bacterium]|nr:hypothetical protein [Propionibacteriales bacterium]
MKRRIIVAAVVLAVLAAAAGLFVVLRGDSAEEVAKEYLDALWSGDWEAQCDLSSEKWRQYIYEGYPFASCAEYADASDRADRLDAADEVDGEPVADVEVDNVRITVTELSEVDGRARVSYLVEFDQQGGESDGPGVDRGTVELVDVDGDWRVGGVDAG